MVFIESTAEVQDGHFYKISKRAEALMDSGKKLNPKDYKFHFYPWWGEKKYTTSPGDVVITDKDNQYFDEVNLVNNYSKRFKVYNYILDRVKDGHNSLILVHKIDYLKQLESHLKLTLDEKFKVYIIY